MASAYSRDEEGTPLVSANVASQVPKSHWRDVHILCSSYFLLCLAYGASQNFLTTVNSKDDLGTKSLGILYMSFTFFSLVDSSVVRWLGPNFFFILRRTSHELIVAGNLEPTVYTMHPASLYLGFAFSIIWIGQGTYLTSVAHNHARDHTFHEGSVIGEFNGEFRGMYAGHQFFGNLIALVLRDRMDGNTSVLRQAFVCAKFTEQIVSLTFGISALAVQWQCTAYLMEYVRLQFCHSPCLNGHYIQIVTYTSKKDLQKSKLQKSPQSFMDFLGQSI